MLSLDLEDLGYLHISKSKVLMCIRIKLASEIICMLCFCLNVCNMLPGPHERKGAEKMLSSLTFSLGAKILILSLNESLDCIVPEMACNRYSCDKPCISMELRNPSIGRKWPADLGTERRTKELLPSTEGSADIAQRNLGLQSAK